MSAEDATDRLRPPSPDLLIRALGVLLRPLVRLLIQGGVTFPTLADLLRSLYVEVATRDVLTDPGARTDSRVSLMTGVHRKEIRRHRETEAAPEPPSLTLSSRVIARWLASPALTDAAGQPIALRRAGVAPSFEALVSGLTTDVRPRALLDEWLDQGVATLDADGRVQLRHAALVPRGDRDQQMFYFSRNLRDHIAAAAANVSSDGTAPFLDRTVHYDGLSAAAASEIATIARAAAEATLLSVNRQALTIADRDDAEAAASDEVRRHRVNLGVFLFAEEERPSATR